MQTLGWFNVTSGGKKQTSLFKKTRHQHSFSLFPRAVGLRLKRDQVTIPTQSLICRLKKTKHCSGLFHESEPVGIGAMQLYKYAYITLRTLQKWMNYTLIGKYKA